jgi:hypothetical protein
MFTVIEFEQIPALLGGLFAQQAAEPIFCPGGHRDGENMTTIQHPPGTMTGTDLIELREQLGLQTEAFGFLVLGNKGKPRTVNRWVRRLESMDLLPARSEAKIRDAVRLEVTRRGYAEKIAHQVRLGCLPPMMAENLGIGEQVIRTFLPAPSQQAPS